MLRKTIVNDGLERQHERDAMSHWPELGPWKIRFCERVSEDDSRRLDNSVTVQGGRYEKETED